MTSPVPLSYPRLVAVADAAILIEFDNCIDEATNLQVLDLKSQIDHADILGITETVASYRSVLVHYDCLSVDFSALKDQLQTLLSAGQPVRSTSTRHWRIPVHYGGDAGKDIEEVARLHDMTTEDVIRLHQACDFRVYMMGFAPGWCYLGGLNPRLHTPRLESPRLQVPAGCISIGGQQGMIGALSMPSGWRLLGQTPVRTYNPERASPFFINAGDRIEFHAVDSRGFSQLQKAADRGEQIAEQV